MIFLGISDVLSMTLAILDRIEVRGKDNITAMHNAIGNLETLQLAIDAAKKEVKCDDAENQQGQDV